MLRRTLAIGLSALLASACYAQDTLETVEKAITEKMSKLTSWSGKFKTLMEMDMGGMKSKQESDGTYEAVKKGDSWLMRFEGTNKGVTSAAGQDMKMDNRMQMVSDGQFTWMYTEDMTTSQKMVTKTKYDANQQMMSTNFLTEMKKDFDFKLLPDEKVDGRACWCVEATPKKKDPTNPMGGAMVISLDKETGFGIRTIGKDATGKVYMTSTVSDVKPNAKIGEDRFVFKAPEGVPVTDMTQMQADAAAQEPADEGKAKSDKDAPKKP